LKNAADSSRVWKSMQEYYERNAPQLLEDPPAAAVTEVVSLSEPGALVEITSVAVVDPERAGWEMTAREAEAAEPGREDLSELAEQAKT
jgi:hypothetical protein